MSKLRDEILRDWRKGQRRTSDEIDAGNYAQTRSRAGVMYQLRTLERAGIIKRVNDGGRGRLILWERIKGKRETA